jgi:hypothetical protein
MDCKFFDPNRIEDIFDITIDECGEWYHQGQKMTRKSLPKLFATALYYDDVKSEYWLITPQEQGRIKVIDVPYIINQYEWNNENKNLMLYSILNHEIKPNNENKINCFGCDNLPYLHVKNGCKAKLNRAVRDALIDIALSQNGWDEKAKTLTLMANGCDHVIARS